MPHEKINRGADLLLLAPLLLLRKLVWGRWGGGGGSVNILSSVLSHLYPLWPMSPFFDTYPICKLFHLFNAPPWPDAFLFWPLQYPPHHSPENDNIFPYILCFSLYFSISLSSNYCIASPLSLLVTFKPFLLTSQSLLSLSPHPLLTSLNHLHCWK